MDVVAVAVAVAVAVPEVVVVAVVADGIMACLLTKDELKG